ncbi:MAG: hypothetical protein RR295_05335, partial [Oscillospiraceae bacterium]
ASGRGYGWQRIGWMRRTSTMSTRLSTVESIAVKYNSFTDKKIAFTGDAKQKDSPNWDCLFVFLLIACFFHQKPSNML